MTCDGLELKVTLSTFQLDYLRAFGPHEENAPVGSIASTILQALAAELAAVEAPIQNPNPESPNAN